MEWRGVERSDVEWSRMELSGEVVIIGEGVVIIAGRC